MEYRVVDVFAERPLEGNPLTVVPDATGLDAATMQAIAKETNHSETTFVTGMEDGVAKTRIFTPNTELPFAGHPTLGTAHVMGATALDLQVGRIRVTKDGDLLWMTQKPATFGPNLDRAMASKVLGVEVMSAEVVSTGTPMALMQVVDSDALRVVSFNQFAYDGPNVACAYVFTTNGDHDVHARSFGPFVGVPEDPATGSAAGPLAAWLHRAGDLEGTRIIHQGIEMGRPSQLHVRHGDTPEVGGRVVDVAKGSFLL